MRIDLIAAGVKPPAWVKDGFAEYSKRVGGGFSLELTEVAPAKRAKSGNVAAYRADEWRRMQSHLMPDVHVVALDVGGQPWSTEGFAQQLENWQTRVGRAQLLVGGPDGLDPECLASVNARWSLSPLTFPHFLVRILVAEQVYRAVSLLQNHPYHRA
mgnify:FL=1|tara:strand:+ start:162 stop:632 length:471 start_codon:yes stop_codon:yes gene_type:complete